MYIKKLNMKREKKNKIVMNYTIEPDLGSDFVSVSNRLGICRSKLLSLYIKSWVEKNKTTVVDLERGEN